VQRECRRLGRVTLNYDPYDQERAELWLSSHDNASLRLELIRALESLPRDYLQIVLLRDFEELSMGEIAQELDITVAAAKSRLHRARAMAREYLLD
jgi:RNA polymerase sigma factor (sigma-70 family)